MEEIERHSSVVGTALATMAPGQFYGKQVMNAEMNDGEMGEKANNTVGEIVSVVKDYNYGSLHNPVEPLVLPWDCLVFPHL